MKSKIYKPELELYLNNPSRLHSEFSSLNSKDTQDKCFKNITKMTSLRYIYLIVNIIFTTKILLI